MVVQPAQPAQPAHRVTPVIKAQPVRKVMLVPAALQAQLVHLQPAHKVIVAIPAHRVPNHKALQALLVIKALKVRLQPVQPAQRAR